jgi:hypothetical protein
MQTADRKKIDESTGDIGAIRKVLSSSFGKS